MSKREKLQFKPYARLLTMLGDQLIKNERIALIELIKNSYDADATKVFVRFENFGENYEINCPMDENPGSVRTLAASAPSPGRGWTLDSDVTLKTSTDGTYRLINWKKKAPEDN